MTQRSFTPKEWDIRSKEFNDCFANCGPKGPFHTLTGKSFMSLFGKGRAARLTTLQSVSTVDLEEYKCWLRCALDQTERVTHEAAELGKIAADELIAAADTNDSMRENAAVATGHAAAELSHAAVKRSEEMYAYLNDIRLEEQTRNFQGIQEISDAMTAAFEDGLEATAEELAELAALATTGGRRRTLGRKRRRRRRKTKKKRRRKRKTKRKHRRRRR